MASAVSRRKWASDGDAEAWKRDPDVAESTRTRYADGVMQLHEVCFFESSVGRTRRTKIQIGGHIFGDEFRKVFPPFRAANETILSICSEQAQNTSF
jgi:hypothetical protein